MIWLVVGQNNPDLSLQMCNSQATSCSKTFCLANSFGRQVNTSLTCDAIKPSVMTRVARVCQTRLITDSQFHQLELGYMLAASSPSAGMGRPSGKLEGSRKAKMPLIEIPSRCLSTGRTRQVAIFASESSPMSSRWCI